MYFNPHGIRAFLRGTKTYTKVDRGLHNFDLDPVPVRPVGKFRKDDQSAKGMQNWIIDQYLDARQTNRKGKYKPRQIARNFFR